MQDLWVSFQQLMDPAHLLSHGGFYIVILIVFAETGLFFWLLFAGRLFIVFSGAFFVL